jgi:hypothetical protein
MSIVRLHGYEAIAYAREHDLTLNKEGTKSEGPVSNLPPDEAERIAEEYPELIWLDVEAYGNTARHE